VTDDSDPPADRKAQHELGNAFRELARQRVADARRARLARRRRALLRTGLTALSAIVLGGGLAVGIDAFNANDGGSIGGDSGAPGHVTRQKAGDRLSADSTAADPLGGPRWGLSTYTSDGGQQCVIAARIVNGQLGLINDGKFRPLRKDVPGFCDKLSRSHLIFTVRRYSPANGGRTLLYGQTDREVQRLVLRTSRRSSEIRLMSDGTFLIVAAGDSALHGSRLSATIHGTQVTHQLG
jgi:hypothetical protein